MIIIMMIIIIIAVVNIKTIIVQVIAKLLPAAAVL